MDINADRVIVSCTDIGEIEVVLDYLGRNGATVPKPKDYFYEDGSPLDYFVGSNICIRINGGHYNGCDREDFYKNSISYKDYPIITLDEFANIAGITNEELLCGDISQIFGM